jgi:hypothetical protein
VKDYVLSRRLRHREVFVPLRHDPGHAQVDFGEALAEIAGVERKIHFLAMDLPHSDACFVQAYPAETAEAFCDGHNAAFAFFGKVPRSILYDNTTLAVARILGDGVRQRTRVFSELQSHYVFDDRFGRPGKGNDKGKVEGLIGWIRRNLLVPVPRAASRECSQLFGARPATLGPVERVHHQTAQRRCSATRSGSRARATALRVFASSGRLNRPLAARTALQAPATERGRGVASPFSRFPGSARLARGSGRSAHALTEPASYHIPPAYASPLIGTNPAKGADLRCLATGG